MSGLLNTTGKCKQPALNLGALRTLRFNQHASGGVDVKLRRGGIGVAATNLHIEVMVRDPSPYVLKVSRGRRSQVQQHAGSHAVLVDRV